MIYVWFTGTNYYKLAVEGLLWGPRSPLLCATLCDIRRHWQFSKKSSVRRWAKLCDIERHWTKLNSNIQMSNIIIHKLCIYIENTTVNIKIYFSYQKLVPVAKNTISLLQIVCKNNKEHFSNC